VRYLFGLLILKEHANWILTCAAAKFSGVSPIPADFNISDKKTQPQAIGQPPSADPHAWRWCACGLGWLYHAET
jgi:hypothetical protein